MKTLDRAMYAIFLLVLLADVAGAQSLVPEGAGSSGGVVLRAAELQARVESRVQSRLQAGADDGSSSGRVGREIGKELFSSYRVAARPARLAHVGPTRNLFDGYDFAALSVVGLLPDRAAGSAYLESVNSEPSLRNVVEHLGSPAP